MEERGIKGERAGGTEGPGEEEERREKGEAGGVQGRDSRGGGDLFAVVMTLSKLGEVMILRPPVVRDLQGLAGSGFRV